MDQDELKQKAMHPGPYVKRNVIPEGMTVTKAQSFWVSAARRFQIS